MKKTKNKTTNSVIEGTASEVKKSKIALYWESRQGSKGEIVNMRAVLK